MNIRYGVKSVELCTLDAGACFTNAKVAGAACVIKTSRMQDSDHVWCVDLENGDAILYQNDTRVIELDADITIDMAKGVCI